MNKTTAHYTLAMMVALMILSSAQSGRAQTKPWVTAYYAGWSQGWSNNGYLPTSEVDFTAMSVVAHMSLSLTAYGTLDSVSNSITPINSSSLISAAHAVGTKVIITIGGWATESRFMSSTSSTYFNTFVTNIVNFVKQRGYDGVDIDWEPLTPADTTNFKLLIEALRTDLPRPQYLLTSTAGEGEPYSMFASVQSQLDQINIMTYDLSWPSPGCLTWYNSALYQHGVTYLSTHGPVPACDNIVAKFLAAGVAPGKLGIGSELAGFVWKGGVMIDSAGNPTGNGATGPDQEWEGYLQSGGSQYAPTVKTDVPLYSFNGGASIMKDYYSPSRYHWDAATDQPYLSIDSAGSASDYFISYEDTNAIAAKFQFIRNQHLGGIIIYELGMGYPGNGTYPILEAIKRDMNGNSAPVISTDTTPPTISITSPANGSTVSGSVTITASASDNVAVNQVLFKEDGVQIGSPVFASPYSIPLNTTTLTNGSHVITATASDAAGNTSTASITLNVQNTIPSPPTPSAPVANDNGTWIYQDALQNPWINASWSATINFSNSAPVASGTSSIQVVNAPWGAFALHYGNWGTGYVDSSTYTAVQFQVHSATSITLNLMLQSDAKTKFPNVAYGTIPAGQWTTVSVSLNQLDPGNFKFSGIDVMETSGVQKTYYVDNLQLLGLDTPELAAPLNGMTNLSGPTMLAWTSCECATSYRVQVATDSSFASCTTDTSTSSGDSLIVSNLKPGNVYYWHVKAAMSSTSGQWSPTWQFATKPGTGGGNSAATNMIVYSDSLTSPWINASWNATVTFDSPARIYSGTDAIQVDQNAWGALSLHYGNWDSQYIDPSLYSAVQFEVYSGTSAAFNVQLQDDQNISLPSVKYGTVSAGMWTTVTVPMSTLDPANQTFSRIDLVETSGVKKTYYVDNIQLLAKQAPSNNIATDVNEPSIPTTIALEQNYPNPFNPTTTIAFNLPASGRVSLKVYDILGQQVATLLDGYTTSGVHQVNWNADNLASGVYIYRLQTKSVSISKKMILMK